MLEIFRAVASVLIFSNVIIIGSLIIVYGYFGVFWRFIPDWPQALAILVPLLVGLVFNVMGLMRIGENRLKLSTEKWLVRCGVILLYWSILMTTSYAGGPKLQGYVYPIGILIVSCGFAAGLLIIIRSPLWIFQRKNLRLSNNWVPRLKKKVLRMGRSRIVVIGSALILWLSISSITEERKAMQSENLDFEYDAPIRFAPHFAGRSQNPLIGGYMTFNYKEGAYELTRAKAVRLTVSFNGTEDSFAEKIQPDNYLGVGIAISGPDYMWGSTLSIDWGYSFVMFLNGSGGPYVQIEIWKAYEFFNFAEKVVSIAYSNPEYLQLNSKVTLTMEWDDLGFLNYYIGVEGKPDLPVYQYYPDVRDSSSPYLYLTPPNVQASVKYFQFIGAWSAYDLSYLGWKSNVYSPEFVYTRSDNWERVAYAYSISGADALLDSCIRWGGKQYEGVNINCHGTDLQIPSYELRFHSTETSNCFEEGTLLWDSDTPVQSITSGRFDYSGMWVYTLGPYVSVVVGVLIYVFIEVFLSMYARKF